MDNNKVLTLPGLSFLIDKLKSIFATSVQGTKADNAYVHAQSTHAPTNAERNVIIGVQKNGSDLTPNSSTRKVNITVPTKTSELQNDSGFKTTDTTYDTGTASIPGLTKLYTDTGNAADGTMTQSAITTGLNGKANITHTHNYAGAVSAGGSANSAVKLDSSAGSTTQPIYFSNGKPAQCTYTLAKSVPSNAVFTDTWTAFKGASTSTAGTAGYAPAPSAGAANRYLRSDGTWSVPPDTNTTYSVFKGATTSMAGGVGLVPAPSTGSATRYLRSDGTWQVPPDTNTTYGVATTSTNGLMSSSDKSKLNNIDANANHYTLPTASRTTLGGVKTTSTVTSSSGHTACPIISGVPYYKTINIVNNLTTNTSGYALDARMGRQLDIELNNVQSDISWLTEGIQILGLNGSGTHTKCRIEVVDITANFNNGTVTIPKTSIIPTGAEGSLQRVFAQLKSAKAAIITSATVSGTNAVVNCANLSGTPYTGSITITLLAIISITYFDS